MPGLCSTCIWTGMVPEGPSSFPKPMVHITEKFFKTPGHMDFLHHICDVASEKGNTYFVFDRGETAKISECCRLSFKLDQTDLDDAKQPWKMRYCALQNVTLNLPRVAYQCMGMTPGSLPRSPNPLRWR